MDSWQELIDLIFICWEIIKNLKDALKIAIIYKFIIQI